MKILFVTSVFLALLALAGCGNEDWMRPSGPQGDSTMKVVALPGGGKVVRQEVGGEVRVTIFNADGKILSEHAQDSRGDQLYQRPGAPGETQVMPGRDTSTRSASRERRPTTVVRGRETPPPPSDCRGELRRDEARKAWVCREYH